MRKIFLAVAVSAFAAVVVHPMPVAVHLESNDSSKMAHCYYLHWNGVRKTDIDMSHLKGPMTSSACWQ
jgi:hypothetical protein